LGLNAREKMIRRSQSVLSNQWDELLRSNQKRHRINKTQQPQDDEPRQPIRIPECEKLLEHVFLIHHWQKMSNAEHRTFNAQSIRNRQSTIGN
jgi:hypothetical protein